MEKVVLFDDNRNGGKKEWSIEVDGQANIIQRHGLVGKKMVEHKRQIIVGKNIGKSNQTTPLQQAISEAQSIIAKKKKSGYSHNEQKQQEQEVAECPLPMLAKDYNKDSNKIVFPCYCQPKIDGVRAVFYKGNFYSRTGHQFHHLEDFSVEIKTMVGDKNLILDGELYSYHMTFEELVGLVKKQKKTDDDIKKLQKDVVYLIFDVVDQESNFEQRQKILNSLHNQTHIKILETITCEKKEQVQNIHDKYVSEGMEGLILRNNMGLYKAKYRSPDVQKYKNFQDGEYKIIDLSDGVGVEKGCVIFELITIEGKKFRARPRGSHENRKEMFINGDKYIGKMATIRYQNLTQDGIPRFPVFIAIRENY